LLSRQGAALATNQAFIQLDGTLLTVSCERIKQLLLRELGSTAQWRGRIYLALYEADAPEQPITITSERFQDGWQYRVDIPDLVERDRFVRTMTQALLLETANRNAPDRSAELPAWLIEGFSQQFLASPEAQIFLDPPPAPASKVNVPVITHTNINAHLNNPLERVHEELLEHPALTFDALSWPTAAQMFGDEAAVYAASAQLFLYELLHLKDGRACICSMLTEMPRFFNWQFAFLNAFHSHFQRPLDVEKWWALRSLNFTGRSLDQTWPRDESWKRLDQVLHAPAETRASADEPLAPDASLQTIIRDWDPARQTHILQRKLQELELLRMRVPPEFSMLCVRYIQVIETYLRSAGNVAAATSPSKKKRLNLAANNAIKELDSLDALRSSLRGAEKPVAKRDVS
jgi:hypothetical protein